MTVGDGLKPIPEDVREARDVSEVEEVRGG
jgi:hypothetical protein